MPTSSLVTVKAVPADPTNTSSAALATSIPTNRFTSSMFHPPQRGLPRLAIRDVFPLQPFGLSASGGAAPSAARRDFSPKDVPDCRTTNSDSCTTSSTYKVVDERVESRVQLGFRSSDGERKCVLRLRIGCSLDQSRQMRLVGSLVHPS